MDTVKEALQLAVDFERAHYYGKAMQCYTMAAYFINKIKVHKHLPEQVLRLCDQKILNCIKQRKRLQIINNKIQLKKYVLIK
jgi:hypothetical protein